MQCGSCGHDFEATNQHSECPYCNSAVGTQKQRDLTEKLTQVVRWFEDWEQATHSWRMESERDRRYYDGIQWTADEIKDIEARGQPAIVNNRIFKKINFLLGMEVRNRADPKALPRTPAHDEDVTAITDALRYVCDDQDFDAVSSAVWANVLIEGYGGAVIEHEIVGDIAPVAGIADVEPKPYGAEVDATVVTEDNRSIEIRDRHVPWDRLWYDLHSRRPDFSDAMHKGMSHWADLDDHIRNYRNKAGVAANYEEVLREALTHSGNSPGDETHEDKPTTTWTSLEGGRQRVRVSECYYLETDESGKACWYFCAYTKSGFVVPPRKTGYVDEHGKDVCPLEMTSGFVSRDGMRYGLVRHMIGPQDAINKRESKSLHLLSVDKAVAEEGVVGNATEASTERARPDSWLTVARGALENRRIIFEKGTELAAAHMQLLQHSLASIDGIGPEIPQIGMMPNDASGVALAQRQQIGSLELAPLEDNHKRWKRACYRQKWYRIRQYWPEEKWLRVRDDAERVGFRFVGLNRKMSRGQRFMELLKKGSPMESAVAGVLGAEAPLVIQQASQALTGQLGQQAQQLPPPQMEQLITQAIASHPKMQQAMVAGDVAQLDVDIVLDESPDTAVLQQEEYKQLIQLIPPFLQAQMPPQTLLELALEASQLRSKRKLLQMLRKPADPQQTQMQQTMQQLQLAQAKAGVDVTQTQAQLNQARAAEAMADAQTTAPKAAADVEAKRAQAMRDAASAGEKMGGAMVGVVPPA